MPISIPDLSERYERLSSPVVYDILDEMGFPNQALSAEIRALDPNAVVAGPAFTFQGQDHVGDRPKSHSSFQMFREIEPGSVLVMATNGHHVAGPWGENTSITAQKQGARGIVVDGGVRDVNASLGVGFPMFSRYVSPVFARGRYAMTGYGEPVQVAGQVEATVTVKPGDFVVGDRDGVVIVPAEIVDEVLVAAERLEEIEGHIREELLAGKDREEVYRAHPKFDHVRKPGSDQ